jgi:hypothetical protein
MSDTPPKASRYAVAATVAWRVVVILLLGWNAWELRQISRYQYSGPGYDEEQRDSRALHMLDKISETLNRIDRNTEPPRAPFLQR